MITKTEVVWRHLLVTALDEGRRSSLTELSQQLALPASTIHKALVRPRRIGAVRGTAQGLRVLDPKRLLLLWAARRDLARDVIYETHVALPIRKIEERLPESAIPTAYSAFVRRQGVNTVADYDQVIVYARRTEVEPVFSSRRGYANLLVLDPDPLLATYGQCAPIAQVYVDLFNLPTWQAQRFLDVLSRQLFMRTSPERPAWPDPDFVFSVLRAFVAEFPGAVLLGGWASYLRTMADKSHDIDVIVDHVTLSALASRYELKPSSHIEGKKYQMELQGVEIDIYPVYQSKLGQRLRMPVEVLAAYAESLSGFKVLSAEAQFVAKMAALLDRPDSLPGDKDRREMWRLANLPEGLDFDKVAQMLSRSPHSPAQQLALMEETFRLLEETDTINRRDLGQLRKLRTLALDSVRSCSDSRLLGRQLT